MIPAGLKSVGERIIAGRPGLIALLFPAGICAIWALLVTWRIGVLPGLDLDEAWYILAAWGQYPRADPLSGMTRYSGVLPILLVELFGGDKPWILLRMVGAVCNGLALLLISRWLYRRYPVRAIRGWTLPLFGTLPVFLIFSRNAIEVAMFGPLLTAAGLYVLSLDNSWSTYAAGVFWGLAAYNHVLWAFVPISIALAWLVVYRRRPARSTWLALSIGLFIGASPRLLSLVMYAGRPTGGPGESWKLGPALADLSALPIVLWDFLNGRTLYLRYVGHESVNVLPYWIAAIGFALPWLRSPSAMPRKVRVSLLTAFILAVITAVLSPRLACSYFIAPTLALALALVELGAAAIARDAQWKWLIRGVAGVLIVGNLFYVCTNFLYPWATERIGITRFAMGKRNPTESNYPFLPRGPLIHALRELAPEQILATPTLERPLRVLLANDSVKVRLPPDMQTGLRTVLLAYQDGETPTRRCIEAEPGETCFTNPIHVNGEYLIYRQ